MPHCLTASLVEHRGGLELPGKPASTQQRRLHGAVKPHLQKLQAAPQGYESYRVYFIKDYTKVQNAYARASAALSFSLLIRAHLSPSLTAWRVFPGCAVFGDDYAPMSLKTDDGSPLFQVPIPFGADYGGVNKGLFTVKPSSEYDTWVTIGADAGNAQNSIRSGCLAYPLRRPRSSWLTLPFRGAVLLVWARSTSRCTAQMVLSSR